jgi:PKD repeat protein
VEEFKENSTLEEIFRKKLGNTEVEPSPSLNASLMRRVGAREFLRFNPSRLNIWYTIAAAAAGTALTLFLTQSPDDKNNSKIEPSPLGITEIPVEKKQEVALPELINNNHGKQVQPRVSNQNTTSGSVKTAKSTENQVISDAARADVPSDVVKVSSLPDSEILLSTQSGNNKPRKNLRADQYIEASLTEGCAPLSVKFSCSAEAGDSCYWSFGDEGHSSLKKTVWIFNRSGEFKVTLQVSGAGGRSEYSKMITIHPQPLAKFEISPENAILPLDEISFHNYSEGALKYKWDFGDGTYSDLFEPRHHYNRYNSYIVSLIVTSEYGCSDSSVIKNAFSTSGCYIKFPNAFTPNLNGPSGGYYSAKSDEASQIFHPVFTGVIDYQLRIYSKRGVLIFETSDINYGWDGYYKGQLCEPGVYVWKVQGNFINNEKFTKAGDLTLLRN